MVVFSGVAPVFLWFVSVLKVVIFLLEMAFFYGFFYWIIHTGMYSSGYIIPVEGRDAGICVIRIMNGSD